MIGLYGLAKFSSDKQLSQAFYALKNLNSNEQKYITLFLDEQTAPIVRKQTDMSAINIAETNAVDDFDVICGGAASVPPPVGKSGTSEKPELLIGLKYDALVGSLFVSVIEGKYFSERNSPDKLPSKKLDF